MRTIRKFIEMDNGLRLYIRNNTYRAKRIDNGELVYGEHTFHKGKDVIVNDMFQDGGWDFVFAYVEKESVSIYFGKKDKNGKEIYTNDIVKYKDKEYEVRYFEEYGAFGLYDKEKRRPLGRSGSSTKYEPYFMTDYHTRQMEII